MELIMAWIGFGAGIWLYFRHQDKGWAVVPFLVIPLVLVVLWGVIA